jgi:Holliday junction resolvasome RuvABC endonuclease subunit
MNPPSRHRLVLGIYPNTRGFAFALFEGPLAPVDWGVIEIRGKNRNRRCIQRIAVMFGQYAPDALVLQDTSDRGTHRAQRIQNLNDAIEVLAGTQSIHVFAYSRSRVRQCFENHGLTSKQSVAEAIAKHIPMFERFVPPLRKIWMSEDSRMGIFDAAALVLTFYQSTVPQ